uniref:Peroxygenase n=1 Tax=Lilium longiflorum TaxID=4690 RepID=PXG_LILLO|nr:RecName: Full=Peroxygenase; AltName: Full=Caleosin [Lilium longiflorum]ABK40508.1 pollen caleosin [Lilium longiflorum]
MGSTSDPSPSIITVAAEAPVTAERKQNLHLQEQLAKPYVARALAAVDPAHPNGTEGHEHHNMSVLQQRAAFFDRNNDGIVYPWETYQGFRAVGFGVLTSILGGFLINLGLSYRSQPSWIPSPVLSIHIKNIHRCKHGSDTESYDTEGRFEPSKFDAIFSKYALTQPDALTSEEISTMLQVNRNLLDFIGWVASIAEWRLLYQIGKDEDGLLHKETIRGAFDGSLFERLEKDRASRTKIV